MADKKNIFHNMFNNTSVFNRVRDILDGGQLQFLQKIIPQKASILEIGCGTGYFADVVENYSGLDYNPTFIDYNKKRWPAKNFMCLDLNEFKPEQRYDYLLIANTIHHLNDREVVALLKRMSNIGSKIVIHDVILPKSIIQKTFYAMDRGEHFRSVEVQKKLIIQAGLEIEEVHFFKKFPSIYHHSTIIARPK